jgi:hypothetical protein
MVTMRRIPLLLERFGIEAIEYQALALGLTPGEFVSRAARYHLGAPQRPSRRACSVTLPSSGRAP